MGRKVVPINVQVARGNGITKANIEARQKAEAALRPGTDKVKPPKWLNKAARAEWKLVSQELMALGLLTNLDVTALAVYCDAVSIYLDATKKIQAEGAVMEYTNTRGETNKIQHPAVLIAQKYAQIIKAYLAEFGLSPSARAKLALPGEPEKPLTPFDRIFGNV